MLRAIAVTALVALGATACPSDPAASAPPSRPEPETTVTADSSESDGGSVEMPDALARRLVADDPLWEDALRIHYDAIVLDGHVDTPSLMLDDGYRLGERHRAHHLDLPRMAEGGLDGAFFSIYVARSYGEGEAATQRALDMIEVVDQQVGVSDAAEVARTAADVRRIARDGRRAVLLGLEGGHALQGDVNVLRLLWANGIRYVTLTHSNTNSWADASTDAPRWNGLNDLGRDLVAEMNRLGVLVDLSHVSDATFADAIAASRAPVILSHSSCRALRDHPRNVSDAMLRQLAAADGVILINFYATYLGRGRVTTETVLDHIEHAVQTAGIDHVGLGSDFDGVPRLPRGLGDVTRLPHVTHGLLARGYSEADVRKILGGNVLRVMEAAERVSAEIRASE